MVHHPTLDKLRRLRFTGMAKALAEQQHLSKIEQLSFEERLGLLAEREDRRLSSRLCQPRLKHNACCLEDLDCRAPRGLDKALMAELASGRWLCEGLNLIINGPTGVGKIWIGCALAQKACREGYTALYLGLPQWFEDLAPTRPRRRTLSQADERLRQDRLDRARRLGSGQAQRRAAPRPAGAAR
jgi:DNA replication protein DnaC